MRWFPPAAPTPSGPGGVLQAPWVGGPSQRGCNVNPLQISTGRSIYTSTLGLPVPFCQACSHQSRWQRHAWQALPQAICTDWPWSPLQNSGPGTISHVTARGWKWPQSLWSAGRKPSSLAPQVCIEEWVMRWKIFLPEWSWLLRFFSLCIFMSFVPRAGFYKSSWSLWALWFQKWRKTG